MKILLFGGTTEGRELSQWLFENNINHLLSVATDYGKDLVSHEIRVNVGRLSFDEMCVLMSQDFTHVIDATHPYAIIVTETIKSACEKMSLPYFRVQRQLEYTNSCDFESENKWIIVKDTQSAVTELAKRKGNILLTIGGKELSFFKDVVDEFNVDDSLQKIDITKNSDICNETENVINFQHNYIANRCFARVLPMITSLEACQNVGIPTKNIIAMQGPFSVEMNEAILRQFNIDIVVTKFTGKTGGFIEKIEASNNCGCEVIVIDLPEKEAGFSLEEMQNKIEILKP